MFVLSNSKSDLSDQQLIEQYKQSGQNKYVGLLFERYSHLVYGTCLKYLKDRDQSKDFTLQIFETLMDKLMAHEVANFKGWLHRVTVNHCLMYLRSVEGKKSKTEISIDSVLPDMETVDQMHLDNDVDEKDVQLDMLSAAIKELKEEQKQCVELFYLQQKCYKDVAEITGFTLKEVKSYIQNGKRNLRNLLS